MRFLKEAYIIYKVVERNLITETKTKKGRGIVHLATQNNANEQSGAVTRLGHQPL